MALLTKEIQFDMSLALHANLKMAVNKNSTADIPSMTFTFKASQQLKSLSLNGKGNF
jgi:hypothetical protein